MIKGYISGNRADVIEREPLTSGTVGKVINFAFTEDWRLLIKYAVFEGSGRRIALTNIGESCIIPHEVLAKHGGALRVGVYGRTADGSAATPTVYAQLGIIQRGADPNADPSTKPTLPVWAQIQAQIGDMAALETEAKDSLVAAINEAAKSGGGSGGGKDGTGIESITYKGEDESGGNMYTVLLTDGTSYDITAPKGAKGDKGDAGGKGDTGVPGKAATIQVGEVTTGAAGTPASVSNVGTDEAAIFDFTIPRGEKGADGADGKTAYAYAVEGGYTGTETEFAAKLAEEMPTTLPNPNALTFTGAVTGSYDGSAAMSVEIPSGGSVGSSEEKTWRLIKTIEITEAVTSISFNLDEDGNPFEVESLLIYTGLNVKVSGNSQFLVDLNGNSFEITSPNSFVGTSAKSIYWKTDWAGLRVAVMGSSTYDFKSVASYASYVRLIDSPQKITSVAIKLQGTIAFTAGKLYFYGR